MKIRNVILAVGMIVLGAPAFAAGCGSNECQTLQDAYNKVASGKGCSAYATAAKAIDVNNCPSNIDSTYVDCYSGCLGKITDCTSATQATAYATCIGKCAK